MRFVLIIISVCALGGAGLSVWYYQNMLQVQPTMVQPALLCQAPAQPVLDAPLRTTDEAADGYELSRVYVQAQRSRDLQSLTQQLSRQQNLTLQLQERLQVYTTLQQWSSDKARAYGHSTSVQSLALLATYSNLSDQMQSHCQSLHIQLQQSIQSQDSLAQQLDHCKASTKES